MQFFPRFCAYILITAVAFGVAQAQTTPVMDQALRSDSPLQENLRKLTDDIGGRVPGTPAFSEAVQWAVAGFKAAGADSVHTEDFTIAQSWAEGATTVDVVSPVKWHVLAHSVAWTPVLRPTTARVVDVGLGTPEDFTKAGDVSGAIVLAHNEVLKTWDDLFNEYFRAPGIIEQTLKGKALAIAFESSREHDILYRHINVSTGKIDVIPQVLLAREDAERMSRLLASGQAVTMSVSVPNRIGPPITSSNVVAEIKGSELPDEVVMLGAHVDSWELGTGALDNGCNAELVVDSLRAIKAVGVKPRRTIRFVLYSGEEQGLLGSLAYVRAHQNELDNIVAELVFDEGSGPVTGFSTGGRKDIDAAVQPMLQPFTPWKATALTNDAMTGTDHFDFLLEGVPTLVANQAEANYLVNYHATSDTYDKVDFPQLRKNEAMAAELIVAIANAPQRIGPRWTRPQIAASFAETHLDDQMKGFGMWNEWANGSRGRRDGTPVQTSAGPAPLRVQVSQSISEAFITKKVAPTYPQDAKAAHVQGDVVLRTVISRTGEVQEVTVRAGDPMLADSARRAVEQWRYRPYFLNGEAVEVETQITLVYRLEGK